MDQKKAVTYSLLAHIRNSASLVEGPIDIFIPLIKKALSQMNNDHIYSGKNIQEINEYAQKLFDIIFPTPVLRKILKKIAAEVNESGQGGIILHNDDSFAIANYTFTEFDESVRKRQLEVNKLEELFKDFSKTIGLPVNSNASIFDFIEKNKLSLAKYLSNAVVQNGHEYLVEVQFIDYFKKVSVVYDLIKDLYLGSLLSEYLEFTPSSIQMNVELLFDTNFIISLLDLNTSDSTATCSSLLNVAKKQGFTFSILLETIEEIKLLLQKKAEGINKTFFIKQINAEDIYNACERRGLKQSDLEKLIDNLESEISKFDINIIDISDELRKTAFESKEFAIYKEKRQSERSAKHDAIALYYVRSKRKRSIKSFTDVNCWFVNNAVSRDALKIQFERATQPDIIKADDLLSILWLSNPQLNDILSANTMAEIGLSSLISLTFAESLPRTAIIKEFEDNIQKYAKDEISNEDIVRIATRIADKQLANLEELNELAEENQKQFVDRLEEEAKKQKKVEEEKIHALSELAIKFKEELNTIADIKNDHEDKINKINQLEDSNNTQANKLLQLERELAERNAQDRIAKQVEDWQNKSRIIFLIIFLFFAPIFLYFVLYQEALFERTWFKFLTGILTLLIFTPMVKLVYDRHANHAIIENYKKSLS